MLTIQQIEDAAENLHNVIRHTELMHSPYYSKLLGTQIFFKCENLQHTGSFKIRGAYHFLSRQPPEQLASGVVTASAGNHAQATRFKNKFPGLHEQAIQTLVGNGIGIRQEGENTVCPMKFVEYGNQEIALLVNGGTLLTIRLLPEESLKEIEKLVSDCPVYVINPADQLD